MEAVLRHLHHLRGDYYRNGCLVDPADSARVCYRQVELGDHHTSCVRAPRVPRRSLRLTLSFSCSVQVGCHMLFPVRRDAPRGQNADDPADRSQPLADDFLILSYLSKSLFILSRLGSFVDEQFHVCSILIIAVVWRPRKFN